jgi:hypothetical protein
MILIILAILAMAAMSWLFFFRGRRSEVSSQGIQIFNNVGDITFSTENRLFKYIGYRDLPLGNFNISVTVNSGQVVFIPILLSSNHSELGHELATIVDVPYISNGRISGGTFTGEIKSPADFRYSGNLKNKALIRVFYGVY